MNKDWLKSKIDFLSKNRTVDDISLQVKLVKQNLTRLAENRIIQNVTKRTNDVFIKAFNGKSSGTAKTQNISDESLKSTLKRAEKIAKESPEDPEFIEPLESLEINGVNRYFESTKNLTPLEKASHLENVKSKAKKYNMELAGKYLSGEYEKGFANSRGHIAYHRYTLVNISLTAILEDSSGYSSCSSENTEEINIENTVKIAMKKAKLGKNPEDLKPGEYKVILEPQALADFIPFLSWTMDRRAADEGYSFFSGKLNKKIAGENINLYSDPYHKENPSQPFVSDNGFPLEKTFWIKRGILKNLQTSRYWARKKDIKPIGFATNIILEGGSKDLKELINGCDNTLLVTRLWYIRFVNRKDFILTGMTRDGLYQIENGEIKKAYRNMRFNDNPIRLIGSAVELSKNERIEGCYLMPSLYTEGFKLSSSTLF